jgi:hypothetical protein
MRFVGNGVDPLGGNDSETNPAGIWWEELGRRAGHRYQ